MPGHSRSEREHAALQRPKAGADPGAEAGPSPHPLIALQRQVGNKQIARMLAQRAAEEEDELGLRAAEEEDELALSRDPALQRESAEEDELALSRDPALQRESAEEDELALSREGPEVGAEGGPVSDATASRINGLRGGGSSLDEGTRAEMESALGASFADVRVHTGSEAAQLNRSLGAKAFTTGSDVFFGEGASPADRGLLAHELTHVVQQRGMSLGGPLTVGPADDPLETEAEASAAAVSSGAARQKSDAE
jgi:hypothetical protein